MRAEHKQARGQAAACQQRAHAARNRPALQQGNRKQRQPDRIRRTRNRYHVPVKAEKAVAQPIVRRIGHKRQDGDRRHSARRSGERRAQHVGARAHREESERKPHRGRKRQPRKIERRGEDRWQVERRVVIERGGKPGQIYRLLLPGKRIAEVRDDAAVNKVIDPPREHVVVRESFRRRGDPPAPKHGRDAANEQSDKLIGLHRPAGTGAPAEHEAESDDNRCPDRERGARQELKPCSKRIDRHGGREDAEHPGCQHAPCRSRALRATAGSPPIAR